MCVCTGGHWVLWSWCYKPPDVGAGIELGFLGRAVCSLNQFPLGHESSRASCCLMSMPLPVKCGCVVKIKRADPQKECKHLGGSVCWVGVSC